MPRGALPRTVWPFVVQFLFAVPCANGADPLDPLLARIKSVGREGAGNAEAASAWRELARQGAEELPTILAALDDADATAANWLRSAVDAIAERELTAGRSLPAAKLESFPFTTRSRLERIGGDVLSAYSQN